MNRIKDYASFAARFAGLGYIALGPVAAGQFGTLFCGEHAAEWFRFACPPVQPLQMPVGLHALGFVCAMFVCARAIAIALKRLRRPASSRIASQEANEVPVAPRKRWPSARQVQPRAHFGLRGLPR